MKTENYNSKYHRKGCATCTNMSQILGLKRQCRLYNRTSFWGKWKIFSKKSTVWNTQLVFSSSSDLYHSVKANLVWISNLNYHINFIFRNSNNDFPTIFRHCERLQFTCHSCQPNLFLALTGQMEKMPRLIFVFFHYHSYFFLWCRSKSSFSMPVTTLLSYRNNFKYWDR